MSVDCFYEGENFLAINPMSVLTVVFVNLECPSKSLEQIPILMKQNWLIG